MKLFKLCMVAIGKVWSKISKVYLGSCVQLYSLAETPQPRPSPLIWAQYLYEDAIGHPR